MERKGLIYDLRFLISDWRFGETDLKSSIINRVFRDQEICDYSIFDLRSVIWGDRSEIINRKSRNQRSRDLRLLDF